MDRRGEEAVFVRIEEDGSDYLKSKNMMSRIVQDTDVEKLL